MEPIIIMIMSVLHEETPGDLSRTPGDLSRTPGDLSRLLVKQASDQNLREFNLNDAQKRGSFRQLSRTSESPMSRQEPQASNLKCRERDSELRES
jgi:hypothetical protein